MSELYKGSVLSVAHSHFNNITTTNARYVAHTARYVTLTAHYDTHTTQHTSGHQKAADQELYQVY